MTDNQVLSPAKFAALWLVVTVSMTLHLIGHFAGWWGHVSPTYFVTLAFLLVLVGLMTVDHYLWRGP